LADYVEAVMDTIKISRAERAEFAEFLEDLTRRRMSRDGRFVRVKFRTGRSVDLVPSGSIASGERLLNPTPTTGDTWQFVTPDVQQLLDDFRKKQAKSSRKKKI
jgi:hypothetical protein